MRRGLSAGIVIAALGLMAAAIGVGCTEARRPNEIPDPQLRTNPRLAEGQRVFMKHCNQCHVGGAAGIGPSLNDKHLPAFLIRLKVRRGLGNMPQFSKRALSNEDLDDVIHYLDYLRTHPDGPGRA